MESLILYCITPVFVPPTEFEYGLEKEIDFTYDTGKNPKDRIRNLEFIV
jgi:hypothetical protein